MEFILKVTNIERTRVGYIFISKNIFIVYSLYQISTGKSKRERESKRRELIPESTGILYPLLMLEKKWQVNVWPTEAL